MRVGMTESKEPPSDRTIASATKTATKKQDGALDLGTEIL